MPCSATCERRPDPADRPARLRSAPKSPNAANSPSTQRGRSRCAFFSRARPRASRRKDLLQARHRDPAGDETSPGDRKGPRSRSHDMRSEGREVRSENRPSQTAPPSAWDNALPHLLAAPASFAAMRRQCPVSS